MTSAYYPHPYHNVPAIIIKSRSDSNTSSESASDTSSSSESSYEVTGQYTMCWPWAEVKLEDPPAKPRKQALYGVYAGNYITNKMTPKARASYVYGLEGVTYVPVEVEVEAKEKKEPKDVYTYVPRNDGDPHPPILTGEDHDQFVVPPPPFQPSRPGTPYLMRLSAVPTMHYAHADPQYPHRVYQYPYAYNTSVLPAGTQVYHPQQGLTVPTAPYYIVQESSHTRKSKKDKKSKNSKDKKRKKRQDSKRINQHVYYGRTPNEIYEDEIKMAGKDGVYGSTNIAPANPKPGDMFWVIPCEVGERARLVSYYEIMESHKPGKWHRGSDGYLRWHKEEPKDDSSSESESSASEWEN